MAEPRMTIQVSQVLRTIEEHDGRDLYGLEIIQKTGITSGVLYPILKRLEQAGWVTVREERCNPREEGRPIRKFYRLTQTGRIAIARSRTGGPAGSAAFAACQAIRLGAWDDYLIKLETEIRARRNVVSSTVYPYCSSETDQVGDPHEL
jgi:PadR family transcriptional regulator, regulatory protein PadR